ncbi:MAG: hypothetical protein GEU80_10025 [Dehalococcoidia bacterium]|nr:hypothetical protein [Dehalococcoidia bacterium]
MYGTIARMRIKPGAEALFRAQMDAMGNMSLQGHGWISTMIYQSDSDPREVWMAVTFESREAYHANAQRPNQHMHYLLMRGCIEEDPEWHDGEIVAQMPAGWLDRTRDAEGARQAQRSSATETAGA